MALSPKTVKRLILTVAAGMILILGVGIWRGQNIKGDREKSTVDAPPSQMKLNGIEYTEMENGRRFWTLWAEEANYYGHEQKTMLKGVKMVLFLENGDQVNLEGREGVLYSATKNIELWGDVQAALPDGYELFTERAAYDHAVKIIHSETPVLLVGPDVQIEGDRWNFDVSARHAMVEGRVRTRVDSLFSNMQPGQRGRDGNSR